MPRVIEEVHQPSRSRVSVPGGLRHLAPQPTIAVRTVQEPGLLPVTCPCSDAGRRTVRRSLEASSPYIAVTSL
jgi:hypothetical protein